MDFQLGRRAVFLGVEGDNPEIQVLDLGRPIQGGDQAQLDGRRQRAQVFLIELHFGRASSHGQRLEQVRQAQGAKQLGGVFDVVEEIARVEHILGNIIQVASQRAELAGQPGDRQVGGGKASGLISGKFG